MRREREREREMESHNKGAAKTRKMRGGERKGSEKRQFKGIRMRKWGKWVAEIREPNKRSRIWLGSYSTAVAAARAYDTAVFCLRGPSARLNFPDLLDSAAAACDTSAASIRKRATEVGARVDARETALRYLDSAADVKPSAAGVDLNKIPDPEIDSDADWERFPSD